MRTILESHSVSVLKKEISKTNIKGYSKMKKAEIVNLMLKHKARFSHIKPKEKATRTVKAKPKNEPYKEKNKRGDEVSEAQKKINKIQVKKDIEAYRKKQGIQAPKPKKEAPKPKKEAPKPKKEAPKPKRKLAIKGQKEKVSGFLGDIEAKGKGVRDKVKGSSKVKKPKKEAPKSQARYLGDTGQGDAADEWWSKNEDKPKYKKMYNDLVDKALKKKGHDPKRFKDVAYQFSKEGRARYEEASDEADGLMRKHINRNILK